VGSSFGALESAVALPFRFGSALHGDRAVHPQGFLCSGSCEIEQSTPLAPAAQVCVRVEAVAAQRV